MKKRKNSLYFGCDFSDWYQTPLGGVYSTPPGPLARLKGPTSKEKDGNREGKGRKGGGREGKRRGIGRHSLARPLA